MEEIVQDPALDEQIGIVARRVSRRGGEELRRVIGLSLHSEVGVPAALEAFRARNTDLIVSLARRQIDDLIPILEEAERTGLRVEDLTDQIRERFQVAESRAELLARDQTLKLSGQLNQMRQQNAGIEQYTWSTSQDERVRPVHAELDGTIQSWASPPVVSEDGRTGHPGDDYQCRCVAIPILPSDQDLE
jgi:SPP1 gp7 family putative phage head morphogenesis protein